MILEVGLVTSSPLPDDMKLVLDLTTLKLHWEPTSKGWIASPYYDSMDEVTWQVDYEWWDIRGRHLEYAQQILHFNA